MALSPAFAVVEAVGIGSFFVGAQFDQIAIALTGELGHMIEQHFPVSFPAANIADADLLYLSHRCKMMQQVLNVQTHKTDDGSVFFSHEIINILHGTIAQIHRSKFFEGNAAFFELFDELVNGGEIGGGGGTDVEHGVECVNVRMGECANEGMCEWGNVGIHLHFLLHNVTAVNSVDKCANIRIVQCVN